MPKPLRVFPSSPISMKFRTLLRDGGLITFLKCFLARLLIKTDNLQLTDFQKKANKNTTRQINKSSAFTFVQQFITRLKWVSFRFLLFYFVLLCFVLFCFVFFSFALVFCFVLLACLFLFVLCVCVCVRVFVLFVFNDGMIMASPSSQPTDILYTSLSD